MEMLIIEMVIVKGVAVMAGLSLVVALVHAVAEIFAPHP